MSLIYIQLIVVGEQFNHLTPIGEGEQFNHLTPIGAEFILTSKINFNFFFGIFILGIFSKKTTSFTKIRRRGAEPPKKMEKVEV